MTEYEAYQEHIRYRNTHIPKGTLAGGKNRKNRPGRQHLAAHG